MNGGGPAGGRGGDGVLIIRHLKGKLYPYQPQQLKTPLFEGKISQPTTYFSIEEDSIFTNDNNNNMLHVEGCIDTSSSFKIGNNNSNLSHLEGTLNYDKIFYPPSIFYGSYISLTNRPNITNTEWNKLGTTLMQVVMLFYEMGIYQVLMMGFIIYQAQLLVVFIINSHKNGTNWLSVECDGLHNNFVSNNTIYIYIQICQSDQS